MTNIVDLHVHSNKSDGTSTPIQLVDYAIKKGLQAFALTDHDTVEGLAIAMEYAKDKEIEIIPGIEFSTEYEGKDIHILGLFIQYESPFFQTQLTVFQNSRILRNEKMCKNLQNAGIDITYDKLKARFPEAVITRAHYARYLLDMGYVKSMPEAFDRYVGDNTPYFVAREKITPAQAVALVLDAGGIPILAHPPLYHMSNDRLDTLISILKAAGLMGIEAIYSSYNAGEERDMRRLADKYHLLVSGGSDYHGSNKPKLDLAVGYGSLVIPESILIDLKKALHRKILFTDLDGTLLPESKKITPLTRKWLDDFISAGNTIVFSSGRPLSSIMEVLELNHIHYKGMYLIAFNGGLTYDYDTGKSLLEVRESRDAALLVMEEARKAGIHCHTFIDDEIISGSHTKELDYYTTHVHLPIIIDENLPSVLTKDPFKLIAIDLYDKDKLIKFNEHIKKLTGGVMDGIFSNDHYLEFFAKGSGKGSAVRFLCDYLTIPHRNTISAGDEQNDISMFEATEISIAMINGSDFAKAAATDISSYSCEQDGLVRKLQELINIDTKEVK